MVDVFIFQHLFLPTIGISDSGRKKEGYVLFNDEHNTFLLMVIWCLTYG